MRLVVEIFDTDDCTYSCTSTFPVEADSREQFLIDFEKQVNNPDEPLGMVEINGTYFFPNDFIKNGKFIPPKVMTIDEWFEKNK